MNFRRRVAWSSSASGELDYADPNMVQILSLEHTQRPYSQSEMT